jgi:hypothetical protein
VKKLKKTIYAIAEEIERTALSREMEALRLAPGPARQSKYDLSRQA